MIEFYERFVEAFFTAYKGLVKYWITFNEVNHPLMIAGLFKENDFAEFYQEVYQQLHHQFVASARAVRKAHEIDAYSMMGCMVAGIVFYPSTPDPEDILEDQYMWKNVIYYSGDVQARGE